MKSSLDRFGRIVIPKKFRDDLGLEPGDAVEVREFGRGIFLEPDRQTAALSVHEGVLVYQADASGDVDQALRETRKSRIDHLGLSV